MQTSRVYSILGGKNVLQQNIKSRMDLIELSKKGVSKNALLHLAEYLNLSESQIAQLLPVSKRTVQRYSPNKLFTRAVSESILQIAEVAARGVEVFGDKKRFLAWLDHPSPALGNKTPTSLLDSRFGTEMILDELGRIEYGVIS